MRSIPLLLLACLLLLAPSGHARPATAETRPNIVLFLVDDLGWQDVSVPMWSERVPQNDRFRTPNLERLAARGMRFTNAYASAPVCTPTRVAILTGQAPARSHITYWILNRDSDTSASRPDLLPPPWRVNGLQPGEAETLPEILGRVGYRCIHVGKAHFGAVGTPSADPRQLGFAINIAGHGAGGPASYYGLDHFTVAGREKKPPHSAPSVWDTPGLERYHGHDIYMTEALALEASGAVREAVAQNVPFFLYFAPYAVHAPLLGNHRYEGHYPELDERERAYASMVETVDAALGALVATLEDLGQLEHTVILFASDNGGLSAHARGAAPDGSERHDHNAPLRSGKGSAYEGGTRVPTVVAWPGITDRPELAGTTCDVPIVSHDLFPTILALAGLQTDHGPEIDGRDLTPLLSGRPWLFDGTRVLGWNQPHDWGASGPGIAPFTSIRKGDWKLIYFHAGPSFELYDLGHDLGEQVELARAAPARLWEMAQELERWIAVTGASLSLRKDSGQEVEHPLAAARRLLGLGEGEELVLPECCRPVPSPETRTQAAGWGERGWLEQHEDVRRAAGALAPRLLLIGDSITQGWAGAGRSVSGGGAAARERWLDPLGPVLNAGISGDRTQHVLWRLEHGLLEGSDPEAIVLMIGTNNLGSDGAPEIGRGIELALLRLRAERPRARILLVAPPPRGASPEEPTRVDGARLTELLAALATRLEVEWLDPTPLLLDAAGGLRMDRMAADAVHLAPAGYEALGEALHQRLAPGLGRKAPLRSPGLARERGVGRRRRGGSARRPRRRAGSPGR